MENAEESNLKQSERCGSCIALLNKQGVWWCDEGNCEVEKVSKCTEWGNGEVQVFSIPHPDLVPDPNGGWTMRKVERPLPTALDLVVKVFKLFSPTRTCPIHGEVDVKDRTFDKTAFCGTEGLSCGHVLLVSRRANGLKKVRLHYLNSDPRNWRFGGWALVFKPTSTI